LISRWVRQEDCKVDFLNRQDRQENDEFFGETAISLSFIPWRSWRPWRFFMTLQFSCWVRASVEIAGLRESQGIAIPWLCSL